MSAPSNPPVKGRRASRRVVARSNRENSKQRATTTKLSIGGSLLNNGKENVGSSCGKKGNPEKRLSPRRNSNKLQSKGVIPKINQFDLSPEIRQKAWRISDFLAQHRALWSLRTGRNCKKMGANPFGSRVSPSKSTNEALHNYAKAVREYQDSQIQNLAASLVGVDEESLKAVERKVQALKSAIEDYGDQSLTDEMTSKWHQILSGEAAPNSQAKQPHTQNESKCSEGIKTQQKILFQALKSMERSHSVQALHDYQDMVAIRPLSFAVTAFFAIETIKPYQSIYDSQLAQVVLTWALQRCGIPLLASLFETSAQKLEYIGSLDKVRKKIVLFGEKESRHSGWQAVLEKPTLLSPLISILIDRLAGAIDELDSLVTRKDHLATEEAEARAVRRARESLANEGNCIICLDQEPNMATLCCGKPVHLNCIAEWLHGHTSCPQCRRDLPALQVPNDIRTSNSYDDDDDSIVDHLIHQITDAFTDVDSVSSSSSSNSSGSSSSGSSSSSSSNGSFSDLTYRIHYGSSDDDNAMAGDGMAYEEIMNDPEPITREMGEDSDTSVWSSEFDPSRRRPLIVADHARGGGVFPRVTFLDPSLLSNVQGPHSDTPRDQDSDTSIFADTSSQESDSDVAGNNGAERDPSEFETPLIVRNAGANEGNLDTLFEGLAMTEAIAQEHRDRNSELATTRSQWYLRDHFVYNSDGYDTENSSGSVGGSSIHSSVDENDEVAHHPIEEEDGNAINSSSSNRARRLSRRSRDPPAILRFGE